MADDYIELRRDLVGPGPEELVLPRVVEDDEQALPPEAAPEDEPHDELEEPFVIDLVEEVDDDEGPPVIDVGRGVDAGLVRLMTEPIPEVSLPDAPEVALDQENARLRVDAVLFAPREGGEVNPPRLEIPEPAFGGESPSELPRRRWARTARAGNGAQPRARRMRVARLLGAAVIVGSVVAGGVWALAHGTRSAATSARAACRSIAALHTVTLRASTPPAVARAAVEGDLATLVATARVAPRSWDPSLEAMGAALVALERTLGPVGWEVARLGSAGVQAERAAARMWASAEHELATKVASC